MAQYAKHLSILLLLVVFTSFHTEARESKFFSKVLHYKIYKTNNNAEDSNIIVSPVAAPEPAPVDDPVLSPILAPAPEPVSPTSDNPYGLYGHDTAAFDNNEIPTEELNRESYETDDSYNTKNGYSNSNYNNNGYSTSNNNYKGYTNSYNDNGYVAGREGMSDTRFLENGKYYYDVKKENVYQNGYESVNENTYQNGYESVKENRNNENYYYGNGEKAKYEFDSMEEYERHEGYPESEREYVP